MQNRRTNARFDKHRPELQEHLRKMKSFKVTFKKQSPITSIVGPTIPPCQI